MKKALFACVLVTASVSLWAQTPPPTDRVPPPPPSEPVPVPTERIPPSQNREVVPPPPAQPLDRERVRQGAQQDLDCARLQCQTQPEAQRQTCLDRAQRDYDNATERMEREGDPQKRR